MPSVKRRKTEKDASSSLKSKKASESENDFPSLSPEPIEVTENKGVEGDAEDVETEEVVKSFKDLVRN